MRWFAIIAIALLLVAVWVAAIFIPQLGFLAAAVTAAVVFLIVLVFFIRWLRVRLKARALERAMVRQGPPGAADLEKRPDIIALRAEMRRAVEALKRGRPGLKRGRAALYALPWYVIVGPPATGKTTALGHSGLSFVSGQAGAPMLRGTAGTRNCDWAIAHEALLLDTAGRFATQDDDHDEWMAFLDILHRTRPERPLDGLLVAVSLPDILTASDRDREELAMKLRARLDEVTQRLEMVLPVYLLLTKADLVAGFVEFWSDLAKPQRGQVWGASFMVNDERLREPGRAIETEFDALVSTLSTRVLERLPSERNPERRVRIMQFPLEVGAVRAPLARFVEALCRRDPQGEAPLLPGLLSDQRHAGGAAGRADPRRHAAGVRARPRNAPAPDGGVEMQSYFLTDLFRSVILPDRNLAVRSSAGTRRRSLRELRIALIALGVALFILVPAVIGYIHNIELARAVDVAGATLKQNGPTSVPGTQGDPIEPMLDTLERLDAEADSVEITPW